MPDKAGHERKVVLILFLAAVAVRIAYTLLRDAGNAVPPGSDANSYDAFARAILSGTDWFLHPGPKLFRPPGYPMVLAFFYFVTGQNLTVVQCLQSLVGAASVVLLYKFGRRVVGDTPALWAAVWLLINPLHLDYSGKLLRETWLVFLNLALLVSLLAPDGLRARGVWRTAILFTVIVHFDSRYVFHLPFFAAYFAFAAGSNGRSPRGWMTAVRPTLLFMAATLLLSAPWAVRNALAYDRFVLIDPRALDRWAARATTAVTGEATSPAERLKAFEAAKEARLDSLSAEERGAYRGGLRPGHGQPTKAIFNFVEFWRIVQFRYEYRPLPDGRFANRWSAEHNASSFVFVGLLLPAFLLGAFRGVAAADRAVLVMVAFIAVHTLLHVLVHSVTRYRLPVEPFYALIAFGEIDRWRRRRTAPQAA